jgi:hypothetical protein
MKPTINIKGQNIHRYGEGLTTKLNSVKHRDRTFTATKWTFIGEGKANNI